MSLPVVDVIIPTLDCHSKLKKCLASVEKQDYEGEVVKIIVDAGSKDDTIAVAREFNCRTFEVKGIFLNGINGARHYGELRGKGEFVWVLDSDNYLIENSVLRDLIGAFNLKEEVNISMPILSYDHLSPSFNRYMSLQAINDFSNMLDAARYVNGYYIVDEVNYGLSNASLVRRRDLIAAGGYDRDTLLLSRMRQMNLARGAVAPNSHFLHDHAESILEHMRKWMMRIQKYSSMTEAEMDAFFVGDTSPSHQLDRSASYVSSQFILKPLDSAVNFLKSREVAWLWGILYPMILAPLLLTHPISAYRAYSRLV